MKGRRNFIKKTMVSGAGTMLIPSFLKAMEQRVNFNSFTNENKLIVIQLSGGNDGLNTVIPFRNDLYYKYRPTISISKTDVLKITDEIGLNPKLLPFQKLIDKGEMCIINGVGYPNPDHSHFRSMDIWQSGSGANEYWNTGWIGRCLDNLCSPNSQQNINFSQKGNARLAMELDEMLSLALKGNTIKGMGVADIEKLKKATNNPFMLNVLTDYNLKNCNEPLLYMYKTMQETKDAVSYLVEKTNQKNSNIDYPQNKFGKNLQTVANLIASGVDTKIYYASLSGFDTHANQVQRQDKLLETLASGLESFHRDLTKSGHWKNTLVLVFSEFGRRVAENGASGTDHGTANSVFILGGNLKHHGIYNTIPDLGNLEEGDLKFTTDFREIYATIIENYLGLDQGKVLGNTFNSLNFI